MKWLDGMCFGHMKDGEVEGQGGSAGESDTGRLKAPLICKLSLAETDLVDMIY